MATYKIFAVNEYAQKCDEVVGLFNPLQFKECQEPWYALHTRSRHEKSVSLELSQKGIKHYLPLVETVKKWSDRRKLVEEPLFPGYIFVNISCEDQISALETRGAVQFIGSNGKPWLVPPKQVEAVYIALSSKLKCDPYPYLKVGANVYVTRGPLKGYHGILIEKNKKHRLILSVHLIGQSIAVEIDAADVKPI
jgi:transcription antitermination factor NusG